MRMVPSSDVSKNFGVYQDQAVREPVVITRNGRPRTVLMAYDDYMRLARYRRMVQRTVDLSEDEIAAVENSKMPSEFAPLDVELTADAAD